MFRQTVATFLLSSLWIVPCISSGAEDTRLTGSDPNPQVESSAFLKDLRVQLTELTKRIAHIERLLAQLPISTPWAESKLQVYRLVNGDAESMVGTVTPLFANQSGVLTVITFDKRTNVVIARGSEQELAILEALLLRLDEQVEDSPTE